jgi:hypothetical protein
VVSDASAGYHDEEERKHHDESDHVQLSVATASILRLDAADEVAE